MSEDKLILRINKNVNKDTTLSSLNVAEADALISLITSLKELCENIDDNKNIKIELKEGSAFASLRGPSSSMAPIFDNFQEVLERTSKNVGVVESWKRIQLTLQDKDFDIDALIEKKGVKRDIKSVVVSAKTFKRAGNRTKTHCKIEFYIGKLNAIGGKNPNIHLLIEGNEIIINCTVSDAIHVSRSVKLYETIRVAAWTKINGKKEVIEREYSEIFLDEDHFENYQSLINSYTNDTIHLFIDKMYSISHPLLDNERYYDFRKFMSLFVHKSWDLNVMKTMLVITKPFNDVKQISELREKLLINYHAKKNKLKSSN